MHPLKHLFDQNRAWADRIRAREPDFFINLSRQQSPEYLWIGCADSRVPANEIVGLLPGEIFVHRNVANVVIHADLNCLSCIQYAVEVLRVKHIIVCGHYGCGGVAAAFENLKLGLIDNWLRHVQDVHAKYGPEIAAGSEAGARIDRLCELNVIEQVVNVARTTVIQDAWARDQQLTLHGWVYGIRDGLLRDLDMVVSSPQEVLPNYRDVLAKTARSTGLAPEGD